jgi:putative ABC transport system permease protein
LDVSSGSLDLFYVNPEYFQTLGIPIVSGRNFDERDVPSSPPVAIIEKRAAERQWPGQSALGKRFRDSPGGPWYTVVGLAGSVKTEGFTAQEGWFQAYMPLSQEEVWLGSGLAIRTRANPAPVMAAVCLEVAALDRNARVNSWRFDELYGRTVATPRFYVALLAAFAGVALLIAAVGIYGVLSYSMNRRIPEIGIRMALGAGPADIRRLVVRMILPPVLLGLIVGGVSSYWLTQFLRSLLFKITPHDPLTISAVIVLVLIVAFAASYAPSRRATRVDPIAALRVD